VEIIKYLVDARFDFDIQSELSLLIPLDTRVIVENDVLID